MSRNIERFYEEWHKSALDNRAFELRDRDLIVLDYLKDCQSAYPECLYRTIQRHLSPRGAGVLVLQDPERGKRRDRTMDQGIQH